jgi:hypothetical protein
MPRKTKQIIKILEKILQRTPNRTKKTKVIQEDIAWAENYERLTGVNPYSQDERG